VDYPSLNASTRWGLSALALTGIVVALYFGKAVFIPMTIALMLVAVLWPITNWVNSTITRPGVISSGKFPWIRFRLVRRPLPWGITVLIVIILLVGTVVLVPVGLGTAINNMIYEVVPRDAAGLDNMYRKFLGRMVEAGIMPPRPQFKLTGDALKSLQAETVPAVPESVLTTKFAPLKEREFATENDLKVGLEAALADLPREERDRYVTLAVAKAKALSDEPFKLGEPWLEAMRAERKQALPEAVVTKLNALKDREFASQEPFVGELNQLLPREEFDRYQMLVINDARVPPPTAAEVPLLQGISEMFNPEKPAFAETLKNVLDYSLHWLVEGVLIMFLLLFLLLEGRLLSKRVVEIFGPSSEAQNKAVKVLESMADQVRVYLVWRTIVNFGLGLVLGVIYYFLGVKFHWQWALVTALLCYIPYLGQIVAGLPPFLDALLLSNASPWMSLAVLAVYIVIMTVEGYLIVPLVMGRSMQLNAITVLLACSFWFLVWGVPGLFLAMPLMAAIKAICEHVPGWGVWANLMSTVEPGEKPPEPVPQPQPVPANVPDYLTDTEVLTPEEAQAHRAALEAMQRNREGT
jgi:predicted PurR-regulated permease PerM